MEKRVDLAEANREMNRAAYDKEVQRLKTTQPADGEEKKCKHCGIRIVWVNFGWRPRWMHRPTGTSFYDGEYEFCHTLAATPEEPSE